jgi:hypothetical protein
MNVHYRYYLRQWRLWLSFLTITLAHHLYWIAKRVPYVPHFPSSWDRKTKVSAKHLRCLVPLSWDNCWVNCISEHCNRQAKVPQFHVIGIVLLCQTWLTHLAYPRLSGHETRPLGHFNPDSPIIGQGCSINPPPVLHHCSHIRHIQIRNVSITVSLCKQSAIIQSNRQVLQLCRSATALHS